MKASVCWLWVGGLGLGLFSAPAVQAQQRWPFNFVRAEAVADRQLGRPLKKPPPKKPPAQPTCRACKDTLLAACPNHRKQAASLYEGQLPNQVCRWCGGLGVLLCPYCKKKTERKEDRVQAEARLKRMRQRMKEGLQALKPLQAADKLNLKLTGYAHRNFTIGANLPKAVVLECLRHGEGLLQKLDEDFGGPAFRITHADDCRFLLFNTTAQYHTYLDRIWKPLFPNSDMSLYKKLAGCRHYVSPATDACDYQKLSRNRKDLYHQTVHMFAHNLLNLVGGSRPFPPWIEEGFAAYGEMREMKVPRTYCVAYEMKNMNVLQNGLRLLKQMAARKQHIPMPHLAVASYMDMKEKHYFQAWSLVAMLIERDPNKFLVFVKALPKGTWDNTGLSIPAAGQEQALQEVYGYDFPKLLAVWRLWIAARR